MVVMFDMIQNRAHIERIAHTINDNINPVVNVFRHDAMFNNNVGFNHGFRTWLGKFYISEARHLIIMALYEPMS
jgi:hypothetical protein